MGSVSTDTFCKQKTCPSAETLLRYQDAALARELLTGLTAHLATCDFCSAELHLLTRHRPADAQRYTPAQIPAHLRRLAADLLRAPARVTEQAAEALCERDSLTLTTDV